MSRAARTLRQIYDDLCRGVVPNDMIRQNIIDMSKQRLPTEQARLLLRILGLLRDRTVAPLLASYLEQTESPALVAEALRALWRSGLQADYKDYMIQAVDPGFEWDKHRDVASTALYGIGAYLRDHRKPDFARLITRIVDRNDDPMARSLEEDEKVDTAEMAPAIAMGGDPETLALRDDDDVLRKALVARFLAERRDG